MRAIAVAGLLAIVMALGAVSAARAERKAALVIGVSHYEYVPALKNSLNDEADMAAALRDIGFEVTELRDPDQKAMADGIAAFSRKLPGVDIAAFYYSGHAIQLGARNFLIPRDADLELQSDVALRTLDLNAVLAGMETNARVRIVLLDACRDNPFSGLAGTRSVATRGLQPIEAGVGTFIAFATAPGTVAADGEGRNSPFAGALLKYIRTPGLEVHQLLRDVRSDVYAATGGRQVPWDHSSLIGDVVLAPATVEKVTGNGDKVASLTVPPPNPAPAPSAPAEAAAPPVETRSAAPAQAPAIDAETAFARYEKSPGAKAFAVSATGEYGVATARRDIDNAMLGALYQCNKNAGAICRLHAVQDRPTLTDYERFDKASAGALAKLSTAKPRGDPGDESVDSGVRAESELHPSPYHGLTPLTAPGAQRITTVGLVKLLNGPDNPVLVDVRQADEGQGTLPGAYWLRGGGLVGSTAIETEAISDLFGRVLDSLLGNPDRAVVFFCTGRDCWLSHNATMRAVARGYRHVYWYRGGTESWRAAHLPTVPAVRHAQVN